MDETHTRVTKQDEGKRVVGADGTEVGIIADVDDQTARVDPDSGITDQIMAKLGWDDEEDLYSIDEDRVEKITDSEVRLRRR